MLYCGVKTPSATPLWQFASHHDTNPPRKQGIPSLMLRADWLRQNENALNRYTPMNHLTRRMLELRAAHTRRPAIAPQKPKRLLVGDPFVKPRPGTFEHVFTKVGPVFRDLVL